MDTDLGNATPAQLLTLLETEKRVSAHISRQLQEEQMKSRRLIICLLQEQQMIAQTYEDTINGLFAYIDSYVKKLHQSIMADIRIPRRFDSYYTTTELDR